MSDDMDRLRDVDRERPVGGMEEFPTLGRELGDQLSGFAEGLEQSPMGKRAKKWMIIGTIINLGILAAVGGAVFYLIKYAIDAFAK